jgi:hypothetical protein
VVVISAEKYKDMLRQERLTAPDFAGFLLAMPSPGSSGEQDDSPDAGGFRLREVEF